LWNTKRSSEKSKWTLASLTKNPVALGGMATVATAAAGTWYFWDKIKSILGWTSPSTLEPSTEEDGAPSAAAVSKDAKKAPPAKKQDGFSFWGLGIWTLAVICGCVMLLGIALYYFSQSPEEEEEDLPFEGENMV